jgi:hypothetical protein
MRNQFWGKWVKEKEWEREEESLKFVEEILKRFALFFFCYRIWDDIKEREKLNFMICAAHLQSKMILIGLQSSTRATSSKQAAVYKYGYI